jgi:molybdopterin/thiamine biosynthesis adenylyltransferase
VKRHDRGDPQGPAGPRVADLEGHLSADGSAPPPGGALLILHPWVEPFVAASGDVYLMRPGWGADVAIRRPAPEDRALLDRLVAGGSVRADAPEAERLRGLVDAGVVVVAPVASAPVPDAERFDRQLPYLAGYADPGTAMRRLRDSRVCVIGCGGLGTWALAATASLGIGAFTLADDDVVEPSNLNRQILFGEADVGRPKVELAAAWLARFDSSVAVRTSRRRVGSADDAAELVAGADVVILAADWPPYELGRWVNRACVERGIPFLSAGQQPPLLRVGPTYVPGSGACFACHEATLAESFPLYEEIAAHRREHGTTAITLGPASGLLGCTLALEILHLLTAAGPVATQDRALLIDMRTLATHWEPISRRPGCSVCG